MVIEGRLTVESTVRLLAELPNYQSQLPKSTSDKTIPATIAEHAEEDRHSNTDHYSENCKFMQRAEVEVKTN